MSEEYRVCLYDKEKEEIWDSFIENEAVNATFLQSRRFLNYHPEDRFIDYSLMIYNSKNQLVALCPACKEINENGEMCFFSHRGSTFGGVLTNKKNHVVAKYIAIIEAIEEFLSENNFSTVHYRVTSDLFCDRKIETELYSFFYKGYETIEELSLYVDFSTYKEDIIKNLSQGKRTDVNNCIKEGMYFAEIESDEDIERFYELLCRNLEKYDAKPVHTLEELRKLKYSVLKEKCEFWGIYLGKKLIAGGMLFLFNEKVAHTQYLCANMEYNKLSPMSFLYFSFLKSLKERGFGIVSWGNVTEDEGKYLNVGLLKSKEAYGSTYSINWSFRKWIG